MLFIHYHKAKVLKWQEDSRAGTKDHTVLVFRIFGIHFVPYLYPFPFIITRMINANLVPEIPLQPINDLCGEGNLRQQVKYLFSLL